MEAAERTNYKEVEARLDYNFDDQQKLLTALTHSSYANENNKNGVVNNERMEFLGDAILKLAVSEFLYNKYPDYNEGQMTKIRAILISDKVLSEIADTIELGSSLRLSKNEKRSGGNKRPSILANSMEAVFGAIYLDKGPQPAIRVINQLYASHYNGINNSFSDSDYKSKLQEITQQQSAPLPEYTILKELGPDHDKTFLIEGKLWIKNQEIKAASKGKTKKIAEQSVAKKLLALLVSLKIIQP